MCLVPAGPLKADYVITEINGTVTRAESYLIRGDTLKVLDDSAELNVYNVRSVTPENLPPDEVKRFDRAMDELRGQVAGLLAREGKVAQAHDALLTKITGPQAGKAVEGLTPGEKKATEKTLEGLAEDTRDLMESWRLITLPSFSLLLMRDIKKLELLSLKSSIEQLLAYVETGDPTHREYAGAHMSQAESFEKRFRETLPWQ